jgi:hypothetical protein
MGKRDWGQSEHKPGVDVVAVPVADDGTEKPSERKDAAKSGPVFPLKWTTCEECGGEIWHEMNKEYYHHLSCSKSNGIGYYEGERSNVPGNRMFPTAQK